MVLDGPVSIDPELTPATRRLAAASFVATALYAVTPKWLAAWLVVPHPLLPWTWLLATFAHPHLLGLAWTLIALWILGSPLEPTIPSRTLPWLYAACGMAGHAVLAVATRLSSSELPPLTPRGGAFAVHGMMLAFAWCHRHRRLAVGGGLVALRVQILIGLHLGLYALLFLTFPGPAADYGGSLAAGLLALAWVSRGETGWDQRLARELRRWSGSEDRADG